MASTLRDELASLRIERGGNHRAVPARAGGGARIGGGIASALFWLIPLGLLSGAGAIGYRQYETIRPRPEVSVALVQRMTIGEKEKLLSAKGYIRSRNQAMIGAKVPGRVERMYVEEGTRVKTGQVLAVLEHNDTLAMLESRRATVKRTEAELREALADLKEKDRHARRLARLRSQNHSFASDDEVGQSESARDMATARVEALREAVNLMAATARETEETIRNMHIVAPFDGTVVSKEAEVGETITPGGMGAASGRGAVVTLADLGALEVETDVAEGLLSRIAPGQPAEVSVSAVPGRHYRGRLRQIIPMGDRARGTIKVKVQILDPDERLFPELVATVHFLPDKSVAAPANAGPLLYVPKAAILEEAGHTYAWVVDAAPRVRRRRVEVAVTNDDLARVESGLEAGESVVLNPPKGLRDGEPVKIVE